MVDAAIDDVAQGLAVGLIRPTMGSLPRVQKRLTAPVVGFGDVGDAPWPFLPESGISNSIG